MWRRLWQSLQPAAFALRHGLHGHRVSLGSDAILAESAKIHALLQDVLDGNVSVRDARARLTRIESTIIDLTFKEAPPC